MLVRREAEEGGLASQALGFAFEAPFRVTQASPSFSLEESFQVTPLAQPHSQP